MNLAVIIPTLTKYGGAERYLVECVRYWQDRHDITIYSTSINRLLLAEHKIRECVKCVELTPFFEGEHSTLLNAVLIPKLWREEIGQHDLYHTHLWPTHLIDLHPMVWFPHEPLRVTHDLRYEQNVEGVGKDLSQNIHLYPKFEYDRLNDRYVEAYLATIDAMDRTATPERIVANSRHTARYLEEVYNRPVKDVIYPGITLEPFITLPTDPKLFVTINQLWSHKRVTLLIEAIALTDESQLVVIGSGPEQQHLEKIADRLGVADRIFFLPDLNNYDLRLVLARACAFLYSPINEPFGIAVLEAMAAGKPVIAVNQGGYAEICSPDFSFLLPPFPSAFAEKISYLMNNPEVARSLGQAAEAIAAQYTWKRTADELEALLLESCNASRAHAVEVVPHPIEGPLVGIQYYGWYGDGFGAAHWNDNRKSGYVSDKPHRGYYSSSKGQTIDFHLDLFDQMRVDYAIINLHVDANGINGLELVSAKHMFEMTQRRNSKLRLAVQIAPYTSDIALIERAIDLLKRNFLDQPHYLHLKGRPVLFWFWSSALDGNRRLFDRLAIATEGLTNIAMSSRLPHAPEEGRMTFGFFRGFAPFSPLELADEKNWTEVWRQAYRSAEKAGMEYRVVTISPGYDDRDLVDSQRSANPYRFVPRYDGDTYRRMMSFVESVENEPHLVVISTFNEYHENTHIEPSLRNGMRYVEMTREFVSLIKSKRSRLEQ